MHTLTETQDGAKQIQKRVAVLLAVYNGAEFLREQLDSLERQSVGMIDVWASDDGSTDQSRALLETIAETWDLGTFRVVKGPRCGFAENFRFLTVRAQSDADYFAFCDQDDLWDQDKLDCAIAWLEQQDETRPALFCSRTRILSTDGVVTGYSPLFKKPPSFRNAIVQSIAGANTMVMNRVAWKVLQEASRRTSFVSHDWWCYLIISGAGGVVHYSPDAKIGYRQHPRNLVGENNSWRARMSRFRHMLNGRLASWNQQNIAGLNACHDLLTEEAQTTLRLYSHARSGGLPGRLRALMRSHVYRQTVAGQIGLFLACIFRRL